MVGVVVADGVQLQSGRRGWWCTKATAAVRIGKDQIKVAAPQRHYYLIIWH